jgi:hypothetical protein
MLPVGCTNGTLCCSRTPTLQHCLIGTAQPEELADALSRLASVQRSPSPYTVCCSIKCSAAQVAGRRCAGGGRVDGLRAAAQAAGARCHRAARQPACAQGACRAGRQGGPAPGGGGPGRHRVGTAGGLLGRCTRRHVFGSRSLLAAFLRLQQLHLFITSQHRRCIRWSGCKAASTSIVQ